MTSSHDGPEGDTAQGGETAGDRTDRQDEHRTDQHDEPRADWGKDDENTAGDRNSGDGDEWGPFLRDLATSVIAVLLLGAYLFAISGVWPPMVAIESGSMEPNMEVNDLAVVMDTERFQPSASAAVGPGDTGVVTAEVGAETGYTQFDDSGDVIVFEPNGNSQRTPIIHRAMFWVEEGEDWTERADPAYLGNVESCGQLPTCPAPNSGFITKGDDNPTYDQAGNQISAPVRSEWVVGTAEVRVPWLGWFSIQL